MKLWRVLDVQIEDIIKFGLDDLFQSDGDDRFLDDVDFDSILGSTVNGEWQLDVASATVVVRFMQR